MLLVGFVAYQVVKPGGTGASERAANSKAGEQAGHDLRTATPPIRLQSPEQLPTALPPVAGRLIDSAGEAIAGVAIHRVSATGEAQEFLALTEADGAFRFASMPAEGEQLMLLGDSIFASTFQIGTQGKGARIMGTRRVSLSAKVVHDGLAVAGAQVELLDGRGPTGTVLRSDKQGLVHFHDLVPGAYEVWAHQSGFASPVIRPMIASSEEPPVEITLRAASSGVGHIVDVQGRGVAARVRLLPKSGDYAAREIQSDKDGNFTVESLLPGRWLVEAEASGYVSRTPYLLQATADALDFKVTLTQGAVLSGRVVDVHGAPVSNAKIVVLSESKTPLAAVAKSPVGGKGLRWVHPLATRRALPGHHSRKFGAGRDGVRPSECGRGHCGVDLGSERGRIVHAAADAHVARVVRQSKGKAGRYLVLSHQGGLKSFYMHLDEIHDSLEVGQAVHAGDAIASIGRTGVIRSGPHLHFAISQEQGARTWYIDPEPILQHAVVLPRPGALSGSRLSFDSILALIIDDERAIPVPAGGSSATQSILRSDAEGHFRKTGLIAGRYSVVAYHDAMAPGRSKIVTLSSGIQSPEVVVALRAGIEIMGQVMGPEGPIADALIIAEEGTALVARPVAKTHSDAEGRYRLRPLSGTLSLRVSAPGFGDHERVVRLAKLNRSVREHRERFVLSLRDRKLEGMVRDAAGFPVRAAKLRIVGGPSGRGRQAVSDDYGHFEIPDLSAGKYQLAVVSAEFPTARAKIDTERTHEIRLAQGSAIHLRLVDAHNRQALVGVKVQAFGPKEDRSTVVSDQNGVARFPKMRLGSWTLKVSQAGYVRHESLVTLGAKAGQGDVVALRTLELAQGATLAGILRDEDGERVAAARVWVGKSATTTDQDGRFRLRDVATGSVRIRAEFQGAEGVAELQLHAGDEIVTLDLRLD